MKSLRAVVTNGKIVPETPLTFPEGSVLEIVMVDDEEGLDDEERRERDAAIDDGIAEALRGEGMEARAFLRQVDSTK